MKTIRKYLPLLLIGMSLHGLGWIEFFFWVIVINVSIAWRDEGLRLR